MSFAGNGVFYMGAATSSLASLAGFTAAAVIAATAMYPFTVGLGIGACIAVAGWVIGALLMCIGAGMNYLLDSPSYGKYSSC